MMFPPLSLSLSLPQVPLLDLTHIGGGVENLRPQIAVNVLITKLKFIFFSVEAFSCDLNIAKNSYIVKQSGENINKLIFVKTAGEKGYYDYNLNCKILTTHHHA